METVKNIDFYPKRPIGMLFIMSSFISNVKKAPEKYSKIDKLIARIIDEIPCEKNSGFRADLLEHKNKWQDVEAIILN